MVIVFFLMSGLFYKPINLTNKLRRLFIPFISFYVISYVLYVLRKLAKHEVIDWQRFIAIFIGEMEFENGPLWFLLSLMEIMILAYPISKYLSPKLGLTISSLISLAGYALGKFGYFHYFIGVSMLALPYFIIGFYYKTSLLKISPRKGIALIFLSILTFCLNPGWNNLSTNSEPSGYLVFTTVALSASLGIIAVCKALPHGTASRIIAFYGQNSLIVMCTHVIVIIAAAILAQRITSHWSQVLISWLIVMILEVPIIIGINKYAKFLTGKP